MTIDPATGARALLGGAAIGASAIAFLAAAGRIAGVSGIVGGLLARPSAESVWRAAFVAGLLVGGAIVRGIFADPFRGLAATPFAVLVPAGLLVGFGASLGSGCTSGHGVCGVSRASPRSIVATITFMLAAAATVYLARHAFGGFR
ncbi:MAG: YeeE/YedE family protein [Deltaproteobacteria bacterium]|nr:YeeE/YedE family protein [Deltaproteobacteria bacterium]